MRSRFLAAGAATLAVAAPAAALAADAPGTPTPPPAPRTAGVVQSYENGTLTIALSDGATLTGRVVPRTRIACRGPIPRPQDAAAKPAAGGRGHRVGRILHRRLRRLIRHDVRVIRRHVRRHRCEQSALQPGTPVIRAALLAGPDGETFAGVAVRPAAHI